MLDKSAFVGKRIFNRLNQNCCRLRHENGAVSLPAISMLTA